MTIARNAIARIIDPEAHRLMDNMSIQGSPLQSEMRKRWEIALGLADEILALISRTEATGAAGVSDELVQRAMLVVQDGCDINPKEMRTALEAAISAKPADDEPCTLGVGCDETGVCYAGAHGQPEQCGRPASQPPAGDREAVAGCRNCAASGWVCENHQDRPWDGSSAREDACGCGAGAPCPVCQREIADVRARPPRVLRLNS